MSLKLSVFPRLIYKSQTNSTRFQWAARLPAMLPADRAGEHTEPALNGSPHTRASTHPALPGTRPLSHHYPVLSIHSLPGDRSDPQENIPNGELQLEMEFALRTKIPSCIFFPCPRVRFRILSITQPLMYAAPWAAVQRSV